MSKMRFWLALMTAALSFGVIAEPTEAAQTRVVPLFGAWQGGEFDNDQTHKFDHCGAWVNYKSGIVLHVAVDRQYGWMLGFFDTTWNLTLGNFFPVVITFDGVSPWTGTARTLQPHFAILPMVRDSTLIDLFKSARQMTVSVGSQKFAFDLDGTSRLMVSMSQCVSTALAIERGDPPPNFAGTAPVMAPVRSATPPPPPPQDTRGVDLEREIAATRIASNLLLQAKLPNARLLSGSETPAFLRGRGAAWTSDTGNGAVELLPSTTAKDPQQVASIMLSGDAGQCKGDFASSRSSELVDGKIVTKASSLCTDSDGVHTIRYFILQADPPGFVVYALTGLTGARGDASDDPTRSHTEDADFQTAAVKAVLPAK